MSELLNGRFICVDDSMGFMTVGKVYDFVDGYTTWDNGSKSITPHETVESFNWDYDSKIAPFKQPQPKDLLQMGRIIKHRNGDFGFVLKHTIIYPHGGNLLSIFKEDLTTPSGKYDIIEIYESIENSCFNYEQYIECLGELVWKREELTPEQIERKAIEQELRETSEKMEKLADKLAKLDNVK